MKKILFPILFMVLGSFFSLLSAQEGRHVKTGWTFGALPSVSFDADLGFQYGALTNIYYYGDGSTYPEYLHSIYAEAAYTTKHFGIFRLSYDSKYLIPNHRLSVDLSYLPDMLHDFYGFNGYNSLYNAAYTTRDSAAYISRAYYKYRRDLFRACAHLSGEIAGHWNWTGGVGLLYFGVGPVDVGRLNSFTKKEADKLPDTVSLFDQYVKLGYLKEAETKGGIHPYLLAGVTYDTRERLTNPSKGFYAAAFFTYYAGIGKLSEFNDLKFNAEWRHYITLWPDRITLAYRLGTQLNVAGESPFYLNTYLTQLHYQRAAYEGLGGASSVRGMMRNRVLAPGVAFANVELRTHLFGFTIGSSYFSVGINPFVDAGIVVQPYGNVYADPQNIPAVMQDEWAYYNTARQHAPHFAGGCGLKVAMNTNFVLSVDWARAFDKQDNSKNSNLYIKIGYMF